MGHHKKTVLLIEHARDILAELHPMTVRQVYYQLVSRQVTKNEVREYRKVSKALVNARKEGIIPWDWIEDRLRLPRQVSMWADLGDFAQTCRQAYRRDVWSNQLEYIEVWLEKDALSGIFEDVLEPYGVTLNVGRGFDGWSSIKNAAGRIGEHVSTTILYFVDFDPSGEEMVKSLRERLRFFDCTPEIIKVALTRDDIERHNLPPDPVKRSDTRAAGFLAKHGDLSVELDALPVDVLRECIVSEVEAHMDLDALAEVKAQEQAERAKFSDLLSGEEVES